MTPTDPTPPKTGHAGHGHAGHHHDDHLYDQADLHNDDVDHEHSDVNVRAIIASTIGMFAVVGVCAAVSAVRKSQSAPSTTAPTIAAERPPRIIALRTHSLAALGRRTVSASHPARFRAVAGCHHLAMYATDPGSVNRLR